MKPKIVFLGTCSEKGFPRTLNKGICDCPQCREATGGGRSERMSPSVLFEYAGKKVVIDAGTDAEKAFKRYEVGRPDVVLITHKHPDHYNPEFLSKLGAPIGFQGKYYTEDFTIEPFEVVHSQLAPTIGYVIKGKDFKIVYSTDILKTDWNILNGADLAILDGSSLKRSITAKGGGAGHLSMTRLVELCKEQNVKKVIFSHIGHIGLMHDELCKRINVAYDGMKLVGKKSEFDKMEDFVIVPDYISIVGSYAEKHKKPDDLDVLIRKRERDESLELRLREQFENQKLALHFIYNSAGPHDDFIPLYNLVARKKKNIGLIEIEKESGYRLKIDLGCGENKPKGYVGIDKRRLAGVDIVADLEHRIPYSDDSVDVVRANHFLEHINKPIRIMDEIWRVLKPDGVLEFEVPSTKGEGAFADPSHKSAWNKLSFQFYADDRLREEAGTLAKFEIVRLEEIENPEWETVYVKGLLRAVKNKVRKEALKPFGEFVPPKPAMAGITEAFSVDQVWGWCQDRLPLAVEEKLNGFRCVAEKLGQKTRLKTEGDKDRTEQFIDLMEVLRKVPDDFILDMSVGIDRKGEPLPRIRLMTLMADEPVLQEEDIIKATCFDLPYWKEDMHEKPLAERRQKLESFYSKYLKNSKSFALTNFVKANNKRELESQFKKLSRLPQSEGILIKDPESIWDLDGSAEGWAKLKREAEIKVIVIERIPNKAGGYNYRCGLLPGDTRFTNLVEYAGTEYIDLGKTFNTKIKADAGDILTIGISEIIPQDDKLQWLGPRVLDVDKDRKKPYYANQVVGIAERANILQKAVEGNIDYKVGDTGWGVLQLHIMGIEEDKISDLKKASSQAVKYRTDPDKLKSLLKKAIGEQGSHIDVRFVRKGDDYFEGGEIMIGNLSGLDKLKKLEAGDKLRFGWKVPRKGEAPEGEGEPGKGQETRKPVEAKQPIKGPVSWLEVGKNKIAIFEPGTVGATTNLYGAIVVLDEFNWKMTLADEHAKKFEWTNCDVIPDGTYLMGFVPVDEERIWMVSKLKDAEKSILKRQVPIAKIDNEKQLIYGIVYEPDKVDMQGDFARAEEIEKAAHKFLADYRHISLQHQELIDNRAVPVESYITPQRLTLGKEEVKKGSWILVTYIKDQRLWKEIKEGKYTGYSLEGRASKEEK